ncbi:MAG: urease accessory protein UreE [Muricoprocola sp.]
MICEKILGKVKDEEFSGKKVDYVDIQWDEAFKKLHRKVSQGGKEVGIRLDDSVLTRGLNQDDVLAVEGDAVLAVNIPPCEAIIIHIDEHHSHMVAKVCYEIGNRHAPLFWGEEEGTFVTPYNEPMKVMLEKLHGVKVEVKDYKLDFDRRISASVHSHTH